MSGRTPEWTWVVEPRSYGDYWVTLKLDGEIVGRHHVYTSSPFWARLCARSLRRGYLRKQRQVGQERPL